MADVQAIQAAVRELGFDGWLLYDFRGMNVLARRVLGIAPESILSRRWFYYIPAKGEPHKLDHFKKHGLVTDHPPIVAVGPHSGDPHYAPQSGPNDTPIREGDFVLIDLWAKLDKPRAVYSDLTWTCFVGNQVPPRYEEIFQI